MVQQIQVNNEIIEFPDNMSDTDIEAVLSREFGQQPPTQEVIQEPQERSVAGQIARPFLQAAKQIATGTIGAAGDLAQEAVYLPEALGRAAGRGLGLDIEPFDYSKVNTVSPQIRQGFDTATGGLTKPESRQEEVLETVGEVAGGFVGPAAIKTAAQKTADIVSLIAKRIPQKITGITRKSEGLVKAFDEAGVNPTLANISEGQTTKTFQNLLGNFPGSRGVIEKATQNQIDNITKQLAGITKSQGGTIQQTGKTIQEGAQTIKKGIEKRIDKLYDDLDRFIPKEKASKDLSLPRKQQLLQEAKGEQKLSDTDLDSGFQSYKEAERITRTGKPKSLTQFIKENGGIYDIGGDLKAMGLDSRVGLIRKEPYFTKTTKEGKQQIRITPDDVTQRAWEEGYFPEFQQRPSTSDLLDALNEERIGNVRFSDRQTDLVQKYSQAQDYLNQLDQLGIDYDKYKLAKGIKDDFIDTSNKIPTKNLETLTQDPAIQDIVAVGAGDTARVLKRYSQIIDEAGNISYPRLKIFRSTIGRKLQGSLGGEERGGIKKIYGALSQDMKAAITKQGGEKGLQAFNKANNAFARLTTQIDKKIDPLINAKTPEAVYSMALSGTKQGGSNIKPIMKNLDPIQQEFIRGTVAKKMGLAQPGQQDAFGEIFSPNKFLTEWNKLSPEARANIFTREQTASINNLNKVISSLKETSKARQSSNNLPYALYAGLTGLTITSPVVGLSAVGGANITARMMTSPRFVRWLAQTPKIRPAAIPKHLKVLSIIASQNPALREEILDYLESITIQQTGE